MNKISSGNSNEKKYIVINNNNTINENDQYIKIEFSDEDRDKEKDKDKQESQNENKNIIEDLNKNSVNKKRFLRLIIIIFILLIIICFSIIFSLLYNKKEDKSNSNNNTSIDKLIEENNDLKYIFQTENYYLLDKIQRKNKVFTQGLFFDTNSTLIESGGLYGKSSIRRFDLKNPDDNYWYYENESKYFAEGASIYRNKFIFQLTWKERDMYRKY